MIIIKYIPDIITAVRIILSPVLLFLPPLSLPFFVVYFIVGLSDVLDGFVARHFNLVSKTGALLDSVADIVFVATAFYILAFRLEINPETFIIIWVTAIALIRVASVVIGSVKHKKPVFLHTYLNKATGLFLFAYPLLLTLLNFNVTAIIICVVATIASVEEVAINIISKRPEPDIRFISDIKFMR